MEVNLSGMKRAGEPFCINETTTDASGGVVLKAGNPVNGIWLEFIKITAVSGGQWIKIYDGTDVIIGPLILADGVSWDKKFIRPIGCDKGNNLAVKTESAFGVNVIVEGFISEPVPSSSVSASISASPS